MGSEMCIRDRVQISVRDTGNRQGKVQGHYRIIALSDRLVITSSDLLFSLPSDLLAHSVERR